jgi:hypothetical protein
MPKIPSPSLSKKRNRPSGAINREPWQGWIRFRQAPFSENFTRKMIDAGVFVSALVCKPGSRRGVRLIEAASIDRYLRSLAKAQRKKQSEAAAQ